MAFCGSGLKFFAAPRSLKKIGDMAFARCPLENLQLNEDVQELGFLCLWDTDVSPESLPGTWTPEHVGFQEDPKTLRLPDGLEEVGDRLFWGSDIEKLIIPGSVRKFGEYAFSCCRQLREVVFLFDYDQGKICNFSYRPDEHRWVARNGVQPIWTDAFEGCSRLSLFLFRDGSRLERVRGPIYLQSIKQPWRLIKGASEEQDANEKQ